MVIKVPQTDSIKDVIDTA